MMIVEDGTGITDWSGGMIGGMGDSVYKSITEALISMSGASVQNISTGALHTAAESDQNIGKIGAIVGDYKPDKAMRMCLEY